MILKKFLHIVLIYLRFNTVYDQSNMEKSRKFSVFKKSYRKTVLDKAVEFLSKDHYELVEKIGSGSFGDVISLKKTFMSKM